MHVSAVVTMPHTSNLPRDVTVNTFHFDTDGDVEDAAPAIVANLVAFYNATVTPPGNPISYYLAGVISRANDSSRIELINMTDPKPRVPFYTDTFALGVPGSTQALPNEVALCTSWQAPTISGVNQARRRGRIFLGPLANGASDAASGVPVRPIASLLTTLKGASQRLVVDSLADGNPLVVYSRVSGGLAQVSNGWIDNEFDTQRRRQPMATARTTWSLSV